MFNMPDYNNIRFKTDAIVYAENLMKRLNEIGKTLEEDERIGITIGFSGQLITLRLNNISAKDSSFIVLECESENNDKYYFIQSTQQINVLVTKIKVKDENIPKQIGFIK